MPRNKNHDSIDNYSDNYRKVVGYDDYYVTNDGRVWTNNRKNGIERFMKQRCMGGYMSVALYKDGKAKHVRVHRLVAQAFIPNPCNKPYINHIDGNRVNNNVENLEWCTQKENVHHSIYVLGRWTSSDKQRASASVQGKKNRKLTMEQANELRRLHKEEHISSTKLSEMYNLNLTSVKRILNGKAYKN